MLENEFNDELYPTKGELNSQKRNWYILAPDLLERISDRRIDLDRRRIICGHYAANLRDLLPGTWRTVVFLRDPVARTLSMIAHRQRSRPFLQRHFSRATISDWLKKDDFTRNALENYQTRVFSINGTDNVNKYHRVDAEMFGIAKRNLDSIDVVGLTEYFENSISIFEDISGMKFSAPVVQANKNRKRPAAVSPQDIETIRKLVPYDLELYELAREKLLSQLGSPRYTGELTK